jgi:hypothetical protein
METLKHYLPLCWCQKNPLELDYSAKFFRQNFVFFVIVEYIVQANATDDVIESFFELSLEIGLTVLFISFILSLNKNLSALLSVLSAILFCANSVSLLLIPTIIWLTLTESIFSYYTIGILFFWYYVLITHILKKALNINIAASLALTFFYFMTVYIGAFSLGQLI